MECTGNHDLLIYYTQLFQSSFEAHLLLSKRKLSNTHAMQVLQDKTMPVEDFVGQGLLSLCLKTLDAQDQGLR